MIEEICRKLVTLHVHVENVASSWHILGARELYRAFVWRGEGEKEREEPAHATHWKRIFPDTLENCCPLLTTIVCRGMHLHSAEMHVCVCVCMCVCIRERFWINGRGCETTTPRHRRCTCYSDRAGSIARKCARARSCAVICVLFVACRFSQKRFSEDKWRP